VPSPAKVSRLPESPELRHRAALDAYGEGNFAEALQLARNLIDEGFGHANALAAAILEEGGKGVDQDFRMARFYYEKATEEVGSLEGWLALGRLYFFGKGVSQDYKKAYSYYKVVDEDSNNAIAHLMLGRLHKDGLGVPKDVEVARNYLHKSARCGNVSAIRYLAELERDAGHWFLSLWFRVKATSLAFWVTWKDRTDPRLRSC